MILQVAKLGPVSRAAGMDCEYPVDPISCEAAIPLPVLPALSSPVRFLVQSL